MSSSGRINPGIQFQEVAGLNLSKAKEMPEEFRDKRVQGNWSFVCAEIGRKFWKNSSTQPFVTTPGGRRGLQANSEIVDEEQLVEFSLLRLLLEWVEKVKKAIPF